MTQALRIQLLDKTATQYRMIAVKRTYAKLVKLATITVVVGYLVKHTVLRLVNVRHLPRASSDHVTNRTCLPLLCLFTTFRPGDYKIPVSIAPRSWKK